LPRRWYRRSRTPAFDIGATLAHAPLATRTDQLLQLLFAYIGECQRVRRLFARLALHDPVAVVGDHCLRLIAPGGACRILFTYDRFSGVESLPQPGPVYVHAETCPRYAEDGGFPKELRNSPRTLEGYARGRRLVAQEYVEDGQFEAAIESLFALPEIDYLQVHSTTAGCFTFRIERATHSRESER